MHTAFWALVTASNHDIGQSAISSIPLETVHFILSHLHFIKTSKNSSKLSNSWNERCIVARISHGKVPFTKTVITFVLIDLGSSSWSHFVDYKIPYKMVLTTIRSIKKLWPTEKNAGFFLGHGIYIFSCFSILTIRKMIGILPCQRLTPIWTAANASSKIIHRNFPTAASEMFCFLPVMVWFHRPWSRQKYYNYST